MKNYTIEFQRFIFAFCIIGYHFFSIVMHIVDSQFLFFNKSYIGDDFFFIVSGFFIANSVFKNGGKKNTWQVLLSRVKSIKWPYYLAWAGTFIGLNISFNFEKILENLFHSIPELTFVSMAGFQENYEVNTLAWYISAMFLCIICTVPLIVKYGNAFMYYIAPVLSLFLYGILNLNYDGLSAPHTLLLGFVYKGFIRALAGIFAGYFIYSLYKNQGVVDFFSKNSKIFNIVQFLTFFLIILYCILPVKKSFDFSAVIIILVLLIITFCHINNSLMEKLLRKLPFVLRLGRFSVYMYLSQSIFYGFLLKVHYFYAGGCVSLPKWQSILLWFYNDNVNNILKFVVFLLICIVCSLVVLSIEKIVNRLCSKN